MLQNWTSWGVLPWYVQFSAYLIILTQVFALAWTLVQLTWISERLGLGTWLGLAVLSTYPNLPKTSMETRVIIGQGVYMEYQFICLLLPAEMKFARNEIHYPSDLSYSSPKKGYEVRLP